MEIDFTGITKEPLYFYHEDIVVLIGYQVFQN
uniref:Uncharacterized protein n=1 Tax=Candidatus Methanogaster sp. ANME-2c ERB4 TaxID=2759911 RepID=A0A7G9Y3X9_9EURY|nr:hypothetical protein EABBNKNM_00004 [Methanosarcinales archaeon ANME-2c ERB4]QNO42713.1 hypothetical protein APGODIHH_00002 [Methanosarcinales archaeon ANME-2c ERB4]